MMDRMPLDRMPRTSSATSGPSGIPAGMSSPDWSASGLYPARVSPESAFLGRPAGPLGPWLRLTSPRPAGIAPDARGRELLRRSRLLSVLMLAIALIILVLFPKGFIPSLDLGTLGGEVLGVVILVTTALLNRAGRVTLAAAIFVGGIAVALALSLVATPGGLGMQDLPTYDLFVVPVVMAGILLPKGAPFVIWLGCAAFIVADITFEGHQQNLDDYIKQVGLYATVVLPLVSTAALAVVSWLAAGSVERAIAEADRTTELERAYGAIAGQKQRLESGVAVLQQVHARVANGDLSARAAVANGELVPLAISLNLMLDRLSRSMAAEQTLGALEQGVRDLSEAIFELGQGRLGQPIPRPGFGGLEPLALSLEQLRAGFAQVARQGAALAQRTGQAKDGLVTAIRHLGVHAREADKTLADAAPALETMGEALARTRMELAPLAQWFDPDALAEGEGSLVVAGEEARRLAQALTRGLGALDESVGAARRAEERLASIPAAAGAGQRELYERVGAAERELATVVGQLDSLLARFAA